MLNFDYYNPGRLIFGRGEYKKIGDYIKDKYKNVFLHYGGGSIKKTSVYDDIINSLKTNGIKITELSGVRPNPEIGLVYKGIEMCRSIKPDLILAVGGGSVIDSAKSIAMGVYYNGDVWDFYERGITPVKTIPVATVLTIPAAGSEQSPDAVLTNNGRKYGYTDESIRPVLSVISPELFFTLPPEQMAYGICDMMSHTMERYFTNTTDTDFIDGLCESTLRCMMRNALKLKNNPKDYNAWAEIGLAGSFCHNTFLSMGRITDWACHAIEHEISALYPHVAHGAGLAAVIPAWMRYVYKANPNMFMRFAINVMQIENNGTEEDIINKAIDKLAAFFDSLNLPSSFSELGVNSPDTKAMSEKCTGEFFGYQEDPRGNLMKLYSADIKKIYDSLM